MFGVVVGFFRACSVPSRVRMGPGKSWNFNIPKSRPGNRGKSILVMESHRNLKFYITLTKYFTYFNLPVITIR
jgi:hypothetical protein